MPGAATHSAGTPSASTGSTAVPAGGEAAAEQARAERLAELFRAVYLAFHRRDRPRSELPGASRAVLEHLALAPVRQPEGSRWGGERALGVG
jgi:hypothetical protein